MLNLNKNVFFHKVSEKIKNGDYDKYLTIPFMSHALLISSIQTNLKKKLIKGNTPILTDSEILLCVQEIKETAANIFSIFLQTGLIGKTDDGYELTKKGKLAIKQSSLLFMLK